MLNTLLSDFCSVICPLVAYGRLKTKDNFKLSALKVVVVAYKGFEIIILKILVFWKTDL